jgi:hypothetical protein
MQLKYRKYRNHIITIDPFSPSVAIFDFLMSSSKREWENILGHLKKHYSVNYY